MHHPTGNRSSEGVLDLIGRLVAGDLNDRGRMTRQQVEAEERQDRQILRGVGGDEGCFPETSGITRKSLRDSGPSAR